MKLPDIGEFGLIEKITGGTVFNPKNIYKGIGDDAAVVYPTGVDLMLLSSDMLVEGVHFIYGKISPFQLGYKAIAVSLSDIAAMGGIPRHVLVSMAIPPKVTVAEVVDIYSGMKTILSRYSVNLVGGDTVFSPLLTIDVAVIGESSPNSLVLRSGAKLGDIIMVTGELGKSAAGLEILRNSHLSEKISLADKEDLLSAHLTPEPRLAQSSLLVKLGFITSMMDLSDGLAGDIRHICKSSGVGANININNLPVSRGTQELAGLVSKNVIDWALSGGEDYELLFTVPPGRQEDVIIAFDKAGLGKVTSIGAVIGPESGVELTTANGQVYSVTGYDHFKNS